MFQHLDAQDDQLGVAERVINKLKSKVADFEKQFDAYFENQIESRRDRQRAVFST